VAFDTVGLMSTANGLAPHHLLVRTFLPVPIESGGKRLPVCQYPGISGTPQIAAALFNLARESPSGIPEKAFHKNTFRAGRVYEAGFCVSR
jgi:hypothetical protein